MIKKYSVLETRKFIEGRSTGTMYENKAHTFCSRIDAYGFSDIRRYQIGRDEKTGMEYIVISTEIVEEDAA